MRRSWVAAALLMATAPAGAVETSLEASPAWRTDQFRWNIAGDPSGGNPNILSELTWSDVRIQELRLSGALRWPAADLRLSWTGGRVVSGRNQDSDYLGDNRSFEFSRSNNDAGMGDTRDIRASLGMPLEVPPGSVVTPLAGWTLSSERLFMTRGNQTVSNDFGLPELQGNLPPTGPFGGLNSHYRHEWRGFFLGMGADMRASPRLSLKGELLYFPQLAYKADADWNLRVSNGLPPTDPNYDPGFAHPKSFEHEADGKGWETSFSFLYRLDNDLDMGAGAGWRRWKAADGTDRSFMGDGTRSETKLNEVVWDTFSFNLTLRFRPFSPPDEEDRRSPDEPESGGPF